MRFDNLVLLVEDLDAAAADFETLGFVVLERADTSHGSIRYRFVSFQDGAYILLMTFVSEAAKVAHRLGPVLSTGEGWADYSFRVDSAAGARRTLRNAGMRVAGPVEVSNTIVGGHRWALDLVMTGRGAGGDVALPYLVCDRIGVEHRIPGPPVHPNGAIGVAGVRVVSARPSTVVEVLRAIGGKQADDMPAEQPGIRVEMSSGFVDVVASDPATAAPPRGLFEVDLTCDRPDLPPEGERLDMRLTHGASIRLVPPASSSVAAGRRGNSAA